MRIRIPTLVVVASPLLLLFGAAYLQWAVAGPPAFTARFRYAKLPGNRQIGRPLHFLIICAFVIFAIGRVTIVVLTDFVRNMNHIVVGTDDINPIGLYLGLGGGRRSHLAEPRPMLRQPLDQKRFEPANIAGLRITTSR